MAQFTPEMVVQRLGVFYGMVMHVVCWHFVLTLAKPQS
ncbi:hypothetical protein LINPERHAP1_LOCUS30237 [Linum perenne]